MMSQPVPRAPGPWQLRGPYQACCRLCVACQLTLSLGQWLEPILLMLAYLGHSISAPLGL